MSIQRLVQQQFPLKRKHFLNPGVTFDQLDAIVHAVGTTPATMTAASVLPVRASAVNDGPCFAAPRTGITCGGSGVASPPIGSPLPGHGSSYPSPELRRAAAPGRSAKDGSAPGHGGIGAMRSDVYLRRHGVPAIRAQ